MTTKQYFVKSLRFAYKVDPRPYPVIKDYYFCCPQCEDGKPYMQLKGFRVRTDKSRSQLKREGVLVSSLGVYQDDHTMSFPRVEDDGRCALCEGWGCIDCRYTGGY